MTKICIIAGNELEAYQFARGQGWSKDCWFYPHSINDLLFRSNFHVLVCGTAGMNTPMVDFNKIYSLATERGKIGRV